MGFAADRYAASFGGVKLYVSEYSISRSSASGETPLASGAAAFFNGGAKAARITLRGTAEKPCADILDGLLRNKTALTLTYAGMSFGNAVLIGYSCEGKSGSSERVSAEFALAEAIAVNIGEG